MLQKYDPRNKDILIYVKDELVPRDEAKVSVFDSVVQGGDAVWEGLRVYNGGVFCLDRHLERLQHSAKAMAFTQVPTSEEITEKLFETLKANDMYDDTHIRLTLTRGEKTTSGMDPRLNAFGPTLIIVPEWKPPVYDNESGIRLITSTIRRNSPMHVDSKIHHNNLINNILAKIQANVAGVDAALMLDAYGFASELNGTNIFMVRKGELFTPHADACLHGITRGLVIELARKAGIPCIEKNISLTELYNADMVFCTGTMGELTPIVEIDGREINQERSVFTQLLALFEEIKGKYCIPIS
jgi:branched-chain amino acid aminotransferase